MARQRIADYDAGGYDYQTYWRDRDYERWAEDRVLRRLVRELGRPRWLVDFGGGFGRNAVHYRRLARQYVIVDYSTTNLANAARGLAADVAEGRAFLVRSDLNRLPFVDGAFDAGIVVRVLHHLPDLDGALAEMGRTIDDTWVLDVPIKHHVLALVRAATKRRLAAARDASPVATGVTDQPFWNFNLTAVRATLRAHGWDTSLAASVNNLRRWDQAVPQPLVRALWCPSRSGGVGGGRVSSSWPVAPGRSRRARRGCAAPGPTRTRRRSPTGWCAPAVTAFSCGRSGRRPVWSVGSPTVAVARSGTSSTGRPWCRARCRRYPGKGHEGSVPWITTPRQSTVSTRGPPSTHLRSAPATVRPSWLGTPTNG
jgi:SAM-dependent methyltransferase